MNQAQAIGASSSSAAGQPSRSTIRTGRSRQDAATSNAAALTFSNNLAPSCCERSSHSSSISGASGAALVSGRAPSLALSDLTPWRNSETVGGIRGKVVPPCSRVRDYLPAHNPWNHTERARRTSHTWHGKVVTADARWCGSNITGASSGVRETND